MGMTITEKIMARASGNKKVAPGEIVIVKPDVTVIHDFFLYPWYTNMMREMEIETVFDPNKLVIGIDHRVPANSIEFAEKHTHIREFVKKQGIKHFYDIGRSGINHQAMAERGFARPGTVYAADDLHATTLGAFGCFATSFGLGIIQAIVSGELWCRVPESIKIKVTGNFPIGVGSRDLIHLIIGQLGLSGALYKAVEFAGPTIDSMGIDSRMTMCNMIVHCEAKNGIMNPDEKIKQYLKSRTKEPFDILISDPDALYERQLDFNVSNLEPMVSIPHEPVNVKKIRDVEGIKIDQAFVGSCASGRIEDLEIIAKILKGRKINPDVRMVIIPPSKEIYIEILKRGLMEIFIQSDAVVDNPNCGPCGGAHMGVLGSGEVCITSSTINTKGRMGSKEAEIYLASPATVAASAIEGKIADPRKYLV